MFSQQALNIISAFEGEGNVALTQYLIACEVDGIDPSPDLVKEIEDYIFSMEASAS